MAALKPVSLVLDLDSVRDMVAGEPLTIELDPLGIELVVAVREDSAEEAAGLLSLLDLAAPRYMH